MYLKELLKENVLFTELSIRVCNAVHTNNGINCPDKISSFVHGNKNIKFKYIESRYRVNSNAVLKELQLTAHIQSHSLQ